MRELSPSIPNRRPGRGTALLAVFAAAAGLAGCSASGQPQGPNTPKQVVNSVNFRNGIAEIVETTEGEAGTRSSATTVTCYKDQMIIILAGMRVTHVLDFGELSEHEGRPLENPCADKVLGPEDTPAIIAANEAFWNK